MKKIFDTILRKGNNIYTQNLTPHIRVYGEKLIDVHGFQYRKWDPTRSKLAAAILNGLKIFPIKSGSVILYLGISAGTTASHVSDIIGKSGLIYGIEFAERMMRELIKVVKERKNIMPIMADARKPEEYPYVEQVDLVYVDVSQPDETEIAIRNCKEFLKPGGYLMLAIKSQSIDVVKSPKDVYKQEIKKLKKAGFKIESEIELSPYQKDHCFVLAKM
ncbi:MAG: fibrillarin-like rRNA/tRNA 2'-O-methyltransferase [Candidatus Aenigmarchaeota archaeon]|nr:fibrillarin-like rRNA/tRNA 2'-O-methyltransferase [Candidatus Aenigmarchaeota archaeon]